MTSLKVVQQVKFDQHYHYEKSNIDYIYGVKKTKAMLRFVSQPNRQMSEHHNTSHKTVSLLFLSFNRSQRVVVVALVVRE